MKKLLTLPVLLMITISLYGQAKQASHSAALKTGVKTVELINGLNLTIDFNPDKGTLWFLGNTGDSDMFITEFIPLSDPIGTKIEIGKAYRLDNLFVSIEYKVLEIKDNKVTRIWFRVAVKSLEIPQRNWI
jgi:hypothetical protein